MKILLANVPVSGLVQMFPCGEGKRVSRAVEVSFRETHQIVSGVKEDTEVSA